MKNFLFEQYGYYPKILENNSFIMDGWRFDLINIDFNEENIIAIKEYTKILNESFFNKGPFIIQNKLNMNVSILNDKSYVLLSTFQTNMNFQDLIKFHLMFYNDSEYIELDKILGVWKQRVEDIENKLHQYLRIDSIHYKKNRDISLFFIGLAINAMQYLSDIIYNFDNKLYGVSIVHKRLYNLDSFDFLNPFNFIVEHPVKDIAMLYLSDYISFEEFKILLSNYQIDAKCATFLFARILYRGDIFDTIEQKRDLDDSDFEIKINLEKEMYKIKKAYAFLKEVYFIRPLDWLE